MAFDTPQPNGETLAWPGAHDWMVVDAADPIYADRVIGDLTDIVSAPSGKTLLRRIFLSRRTVRIMRVAATNPPNAWVRASKALAGAQAGSDAVVAYDPADWPNQAYAKSPRSDAVLFALLGEACRFAEGAAVSVGEAAGASLLFDGAEITQYRQDRGHV